MLAESDYVVLLLAGDAGDARLHELGAAQAHEAGAYLLNFGRGELIVDADLIDAVTARTIAGAVLDVFATEPLPAEHPFWGTEGITVLPHIGGLHPGRDGVVAELFVENLERFLAGQPLLHAVDRAAGDIDDGRAGNAPGGARVRLGASGNAQKQRVRGRRPPTPAPAPRAGASSRQAIRSLGSWSCWRSLVWRLLLSVGSGGRACRECSGWRWT